VTTSKFPAKLSLLIQQILSKLLSLLSVIKYFGGAVFCPTLFYCTSPSAPGRWDTGPFYLPHPRCMVTPLIQQSRSGVPVFVWWVVSSCRACVCEQWWLWDADRIWPPAALLLSSLDITATHSINAIVGNRIRPHSPVHCATHDVYSLRNLVEISAVRLVVFYGINTMRHGDITWKHDAIHKTGSI